MHWMQCSLLKGNRVKKGNEFNWMCDTRKYVRTDKSGVVEQYVKERRGMKVMDGQGELVVAVKRKL